MHLFIKEKTMTEHVWISNIIRNHDTGWLDYNLSVEGKIDSFILEQYRHVLSKDECQQVENKYKESINNYADLAQKFTGKKKLAPEYIPDRFYKMPEIPLICEQSIFMGMGQLIFLNEKSAEILKQYNLGNTDIIKLDPYDAVSGERIECECSFYLLNIAETNEYCDLEKSKNIAWWKNPSKKLTPYENPDLVEDGFIINSAALETGLDLWADSRLRDSFFISNRLKKALDDAGISQDWLLSRCVVER